jgi:hypothetical protein
MAGLSFFLSGNDRNRMHGCSIIVKKLDTIDQYEKINIDIIDQLIDMELVLRVC